ncbi:uncharacterized protein BDZ99DRAFT_501336 [Mytilinidion resinicola]|uniref:Altered inheritance of mitochondria protein 9, mitochondrial n=1 Tax=Mytilinidion resinicola TaxID=574789 RepID=A0A6A6YCT5_9PEZI|nr:uncharacterized protein BDZ99DRAFT_501336 [Mytilinidion resinicola]KAF2806520.1 hypothetical protein BDZ99DRAFT_501336 [Mytilinidion resinicola]
MDRNILMRTSSVLRCVTSRPVCAQHAFGAFLADKTRCLQPQVHQQLSHYAQLHHSEQSIASQSLDPLDPHAYTSGRWLRRDTSERESRYITFDFDALCEKVLTCSHGAASIISYEKKEGGFNRVFIFTLDNAKRVVARLPFKLAGPPRLTTTSEVATIRYLQMNTGIPIPKIIDWNDDASTPIGTEYILMEHASGIQLHQRWPTMTSEQQVRCISDIYQKLKEMAAIKFPVYGSLYMEHSLPSSASQHVLEDPRFSIGPHCGAMYWDCEIGESRYYHNTVPNRGPRTSLRAYCDGLIDTGISRIPPSEPVLPKRPRYHGTIEEHLGLLESGRIVLKKISEDSRVQDAATPTLFHPDLHKRNIFVSDDDPTSVTAIIDWQSAAVEPAFWYADLIPDFAKPIPHPTLEDQLEFNSEQCVKVFNISTQFLTPTLARPRLMDEAFFRPYRYCYRTWKDGAVAFRDELIQTARRWEELGLADTCPYPTPTPVELATHKKEYQLFLAAQELRSNLSVLLNTATDGWAPPEDWETVKQAHKEYYDGILEAVLNNGDPDDDEPIRSEDDLREIWPFDLEMISSKRPV